MAQNKMDEGEALTLIRHYGSKIAAAGGGIGGESRADIIDMADRITVLAKHMRGKNSLYLRDEQ